MMAALKVCPEVQIRYSRGAGGIALLVAVEERSLRDRLVTGAGHFKIPRAMVPPQAKSR